MNNYFDRQEKVVGKEVGNKIKGIKNFSYWCNAGSNEVLKNLALMGFDNFTIVDLNLIEDSNLSHTTLFSKSNIGKPKTEIAAKSLQQISLHESPNIRGIDFNNRAKLHYGSINEEAITMFVNRGALKLTIVYWRFIFSKENRLVQKVKKLFDLGFYEKKAFNHHALK
jgi:hypothetical protein